MRSLCLALLALLLVTVLVAWSLVPIAQADEKTTSTPCVGDPLNCAPLTTETPQPTIPLCPIEWCPNPPEGERCHCPISYTLIAPTQSSAQGWQALFEALARRIKGQ